MKCPRCKNSKYCKNGFVQLRQRYQCKACKFRYTVERKSSVQSLATKQLAIDMYTEGLGFRAIGPILKVSNVAVLKWVKALGKAHCLPTPTSQPNPIKVIEIDEIHSYVQSKKSNAGPGLQLIEKQGNSFPSFVGIEVHKLV